MRKNTKKKNNLIKSFYILFITTITVVLFSFSKYKSTMAQKATAKVAEPIINFEETILLNDLKPGDIKEYEFNINNEKEKTTETTMKYIIKVETKCDLPLIITLHEKQDEVLSENLLNDQMTTNEKEMNPDETISTDYVLKIKWAETETNYKYANEIDYVFITVDSEQVD